MNDAPMYWILYLPSATSLVRVGPTVCSNEAQIGQRESSYSLRVFLALSLPMTTVVPSVPEVFLGATTVFSSLSESQWDGLFSCITA